MSEEVNLKSIADDISWATNEEGRVKGQTSVEGASVHVKRFYRGRSLVQ